MKTFSRAQKDWIKFRKWHKHDCHVVFYFYHLCLWRWGSNCFLWPADLNKLTISTGG